MSLLRSMRYVLSVCAHVPVRSRELCESLKTFHQIMSAPIGVAATQQSSRCNLSFQINIEDSCGPDANILSFLRGCLLSHTKSVCVVKKETLTQNAELSKRDALEW